MMRLKVATAAVLAAALPINLLVDFGYPFFSMEVIGIAACLALAGAFIGALTANSFLYSYFLALLAYFFAEIYYFNWGIAQNIISLVIFFAFILVLRKTGTLFLPYLLVFAAAFSLSAFLKPQQPALAVSGAFPGDASNLEKSLLHIVLDEMASPYASDIPPSSGHPAQLMLDDLAAQGLHVEAQAYAVDARTVRSMSAIFALDPDRSQFEAFLPGSAVANSVAENHYMHALLEKGYRVSILQSNYLDYCSGLQNIVCQTYSRIGHVSSFSNAEIGERMKFAVVSLHETMRSATRSGVLAYFYVTRWLGGSSPVLDSSVPLISYELMRGEVTKQASEIEPGEVHFIHLLLPHFPYAYDQDCRRLPIGRWGYPDRHTPRTNSALSYARYWDQVACVVSTLKEILRVTADKEYLTTVVHGDHGARVHWLTENATVDDDLKTFLAVRSPALSPGVRTAPVNLQESVIEILESFIR